ncbi:MAG TPA: protein phosphatase 2C domain-containing protein [Gemmataceae bacterium]|nr:protein phosphatase 2C domain-containing protein [Gemmataceae bacterium]
MSVQVRCPHCSALGAVPDDILGVPVMCGTCKRSFWVRSPLAAPPAGEAAGLAAINPPAPAAPPPPPAAAHFEVAGVSSAGRVRKQNEDSFLAQLLTWSGHDRGGETALAIVADGLGGHEAGEEASNLVVQSAGAALLNLLAGAAIGRGDPVSPKAITDAIELALQQANREVHEEAKAEARKKGMGATAAVVVVREGEARVGHVGDARVYHQRGDRLTQITRDQTLAQRMVELGRLSPKEALVHPARNDVYQALGFHPTLKPVHYEVKLAAGDWLIVTSDGLHAHVGAEELQQVVARAEPSAAKLATALVDLTNEKGGADNCTVVALRCH